MWKFVRRVEKALTTSPVLGFTDVSKEFILDTDASFDTIVLSQIDDNCYETAIAYGSHAMNSHEKGYCITKKRTISNILFLSTFQSLLTRKKIHTKNRSQDHNIYVENKNTDYRAVSDMDKPSKQLRYKIGIQKRIKTQ